MTDVVSDIPPYAVVIQLSLSNYTIKEWGFTDLNYSSRGGNMDEQTIAITIQGKYAVMVNALAEKYKASVKDIVEDAIREYYADEKF